jgi:hypothetical protein
MGLEMRNGIQGKVGRLSGMRKGIGTNESDEGFGKADEHGKQVTLEE